MRFSPGCNCCGPGECLLCNNGTAQAEYDVTFFPGEAEEFTLTVADPVSIEDDDYDGFGCCTWTYAGTVSDFPGFFDDGNGDCSGTTPVNLSLQLYRSRPRGGALNPAPCNPDHVTWLFAWRLDMVVQCEPNDPNRNNGTASATDGNAVKFSGETDVSDNETVDCSLTGDNVLTFDDWDGVGDSDCDGPVVQGCLDCPPTFPGGPCDFPSGGADVENAA